MHWSDCRTADGHDHVRSERDELLGVPADGLGSATGQAIVDLQVSLNRPAQLLETSLKHRAPCFYFWIARSEWHEHADAPHALLRSRGDRPCGCCTTQNTEKLPPPHVRHQAQDI